MSHSYLVSGIGEIEDIAVTSFVSKVWLRGTCWCSCLNLIHLPKAKEPSQMCQSTCNERSTDENYKRGACNTPWNFEQGPTYCGLLPSWMGEHGKDGKHKQITWNILFMIQDTLFVKQMTHTILFYGIYGDRRKNHNIRAWRTWSWVSSILEKVKPFVEACFWISRPLCCSIICRIVKYQKEA